MKVVYLKVLKDVLCESVEIEWLVDYVILWIQCRILWMSSEMLYKEENKQERKEKGKLLLKVLVSSC